MPNFKISNNKIFLLIAQPLLGDQLMSDLLRMILEPIFGTTILGIKPPLAKKSPW